QYIILSNKWGSVHTRKISAFFIFLEDVSNGIPFAVFRKSANKRGRLSEKDKTEMFTAKHLKMTNGRRGVQDTCSIKHAQKRTYSFV
uniref:hypothetical protein n=1 Tax=Anaerotignum lactatifermentans TaxID=160404 RepID=UPI003AB25EE2